LTWGPTTFSEVLGFVTRIWASLSAPNVMTIAPVGDVLRITLRVYDLGVPPADRDQPTSAKDLAFDVGSETFGVRRLLAG
jgi:hypothetical protein